MLDNLITENRNVLRKIEIFRSGNSLTAGLVGYWKLLECFDGELSRMPFTQFPEICSRVLTFKQIFGLLNRFNYNSHVSQLSLFIFIVSSLLLPAAQAASYWLDENGTALTSGLVGYWKFSEGSGSTTNDSSGYNNHGTWFDGRWYIND